MVLMIVGDLTAESSATLVSSGGSFTLNGSAPGSKRVDVLIVASRGDSGDGMNPMNSEENGLPSGIIYELASVSNDFTWSVDIDVQEGADTGPYLVFVLSPEKNTIYDGIGTGSSDDLMKKITIEVETAEVKFYSIADVDIGSNLIITGTSNRGRHFIIVKVKGPVNLETKFATVENAKCLRLYL